MTTQLAGPATRFLPFNLGAAGGAGNPLNPTGHRTSYLWEQVWARDGWLEILGRYLVTQRNDKKQITGVVFPRYHQLDATRKLQAAVLAEGAGGKYLIQHSAGSGKTNSIAWSAHFLSDLHDADNNKLFATVIVVSDRRVIDGQLQDALFDFQRTRAASSPPSRTRGRPRAPSWPRPWTKASGSSSAPSRPSLSPWRPCESWPPRRANGSR